MNKKYGQSMNIRIITGILVDVETNKIKKYDLRYRDLNDLYKVLKCDTFDVVTRRIGSKTFDIYLDDNGLLKENIPSALSLDHKEVLVGNLFVCHHDQNGDIKSLTEFERDYILEHEMTVGSNSDTYAVLRYGFIGAR